jgi:hypothetical protein
MTPGDERFDAGAGGPQRHTIGAFLRLFVPIAVALFTLMGTNAAGAFAATYNVDNNADTGGACAPAPASCTLRQAVNTATSGSDVITVQANHYVLGSALSITANATINGAGASTTSIDANNGSQVFAVSGSVTSLTLSGVKVTRGASGSDGNGLEWSATGAATLNITGSIFTDNHASGGGSGAGVAVSGGTGATTINVTDSTFSSNTGGPTTGGNGAGLYVSGGSGGTTINIARSTFSGNSTSHGGNGGAVYLFAGTVDDALHITRSTFSGNSTAAGGNGGAVYDNGGGTSTIVNSTFSGNTVGSGEGGALYLSSVTATLTNDTIASNQVASGGENAGIFGAAGVTANNTIIADDASSSDDCDAPVASSDHSLQAASLGCGLDRTGNPMLAALADNGGPTQTMAPQTGSAAIDSGDSAKCPGTDQRDEPRPGGPACDIGAFEVQNGTPPTITLTTPADGAHYKQGRKVNAAYSCSDPAGIAFCQGPAQNGHPIDTSTTGRHSFTVQARDNAGRTATKTVHYTVDSTESTPPRISGLPADQGCVPRGLKLKISVHPRRLVRAAVFLDGRQIAVSKKPDFKVRYPASKLGPGRHRIKIVREYKSGTKRRSTFTFVRCRHGGRSPHIRTEGTPDLGTCTAAPFKIVVTIKRAAVKSIVVKLDGKKFAKPGKTKFTLTIDVGKLKAGSHLLTITAADRFKNGAVSITHFVRCA